MPRPNSKPKAAVSGSRLAEVPEFAAAPPGTAPPACPNCGEPFERWLRLLLEVRHTQRRVASEGVGCCRGAKPPEPAEPCPKCGSSNVTPGKLLPSRHSISATFRPAGARIFSLSLSHGVDLSTDPAFACLDCGLVWGYLRPDELKEFISKHCARSDQQDAYALLAEGARLESKGDTAGALATYEAVMEKFPGTGAAKDAEFSIRNLRDTLT